MQINKQMIKEMLEAIHNKSDGFNYLYAKQFHPFLQMYPEVDEEVILSHLKYIVDQGYAKGKKEGNHVNITWLTERGLSFINKA